MKMQSVLWGLLGVLLGWRVSLALPLGNHQYHDTREGSDSCAEAVAIYELPFTDSGDTWNFNDTYGNPAPDVWYSFTMVETGEMDISLCSSSFDTYLWILQGDCLTEVAHNDDSCGLQSELNLTLAPGEYHICVEGWSNMGGSYTLDVDGSGILPETGNDCENAFPVDGFPYSDTRDSRIFSDTGFAPSRDVYYRFMILEESEYLFTTCAEAAFPDQFDTQLTLLGEDCSTIVAQNDDGCPDGAYDGWSTLQLTLPQGSYYLVVEGAGNAEGVYQLRMENTGSCPDPQCPDWGIAEVEPNDGGSEHDSIADGETHCGTVSSSALDLDYDLFQFTLAGSGFVSLFLDAEAQAPVEFNLVSELSGEPEIVQAGTAVNNCGDYLISLILDAGTYSAQICYDDYYPDNPQCEYVLTMAADGVEPNPETPLSTELSGNFPNPFNPRTEICFSLDRRQWVQVAVYDLRGRPVSGLGTLSAGGFTGENGERIYQGVLNAGTYTLPFRGDDLPGGIYFCVLQTESQQWAHKMLLVK